VNKVGGGDRTGRGFLRELLFAPLTTRSGDGNDQHQEAGVHQSHGPEALAIELTVLVAREPERAALG